MVKDCARKNREKVFSNNRNLEDNNIMDEQSIQRLQQIIEQNQREIKALRQQLAQQDRTPQFQLTADQVLNRFQHIKTFTGKGHYSLQEFIYSVENVASLSANNIPLMQFGLQMIFKEKIQGDARRCIQRLGDNLTWEEVNTELKTEFRPRKSYKKLFDECRNLNVSNLKELFNIIRSINYQLNELYEFDDNKPSNYSPDNNDKNLVDIVKDMLTGSYRMNIKYDITINEVFNVFDKLGLLEESDVIHYNYRRFCRDSRNNIQCKNVNRSDNNTNSRNNNPNNQSKCSSENPKQNELPQRDRNTSNTSNSRQYRQENNTRQEKVNKNYSGEFRKNNTNYNNNNSNNPITPMEIDNIQQEEDVNFQNEPSKTDYR